MDSNPALIHNLIQPVIEAINRVTKRDANKLLDHAYAMGCEKGRGALVVRITDPNFYKQQGWGVSYEYIHYKDILSPKFLKNKGWEVLDEQQQGSTKNIISNQEILIEKMKNYKPENQFVVICFCEIPGERSLLYSTVYTVTKQKEDKKETTGDKLTPVNLTSVKGLAHNEYCSYCNKKGTKEAKLLQCSACKNSSYCNKVCQLNDWKRGHKLICSQLVKLFQNTSNYMEKSQKPITQLSSPEEISEAFNEIVLPVALNN